VDEDDDESVGFPILVVCSGVTHAVRVDPAGTVRDVKLRMASITGAAVDQQRLIVKGKELSDGDAFESLGLSERGKMMITYRAGFHLETEGAEAVKSMVGKTLELETRLAIVLRKQKHRLTSGQELLALLGALDEDAHAVSLDLQNARVKPEIETQRGELLERVTRLLGSTAGMRREIRP
jgi:hypothetical protein